MNAFSRLASVLGTDKAQHLLVGTAIGLVATPFAAQAGPLVAAAASTALAAVAGAAKELADHLANKAAAEQGLPAPHSVELLDFLATTAGGAYAGAIVAAGLVVAAHA